MIYRSDPSLPHRVSEREMKNIRRIMTIREAGGSTLLLEPKATTLTFADRSSDSFSFQANYELDESSDGIFPDLEAVTISFGTFEETLSAGAFVCTGHECSYSADSRAVPEYTRRSSR